MLGISGDTIATHEQFKMALLAVLDRNLTSSHFVLLRAQFRHFTNKLPSFSPRHSGSTEYASKR
jgi:hypothetical protein